jgi:hypothetical protein
MRRAKKYLFVALISFSFVFVSIPLAFSWGFLGHKTVNHEAIYALPQPLLSFYKRNSSYISDHASDPDKRKHYDSTEGQRHFIDVDHYGLKGFDELPKYWKAAIAKYPQDTLYKYGTVPWEVLYWLQKLTDAFTKKDKQEIVKASAYIGHYIADAHVPLHTVTNYDGQMTEQQGIHALWESSIPEMYKDKYNFSLGKVGYIKDPEAKIFEIIRRSFLLSPMVFKAQRDLESQFPGDRKYTSKAEDKYKPEYVFAYNKALNGMVEKQMQLSVLDVAGFWYTAWVNAGQPDI